MVGCKQTKGQRIMSLRVTLAGWVAGTAFLMSAGTVNATSSETYRQLNLFGDVFERVRSDYVENVDDAEAIEAAINGLLTSLDPHSSYMNPKVYRETQVQTEGEFGGLGIEVTMENGFVKVISPIDDTPASRAGLQPGDLITHLDGEGILGLTLTEAVERMRGPIDSELTITIARIGQDKPLDVVLTRALVKIKSVRHRTEGDVGYIRISSFNKHTETGVKAAIKSITNELKEGLRGYVLDLRNNPGGLLDQAIAVSDAFLKQGEIVSTRGRSPEDVQRFNARTGDLAEEKPIVILINGGSASASEIVAGALQDHRRALVLGTRSFGKGSVQTLIPLGGEGAIRLTTARYYTPSGTSIQAKGITPDIVVEQKKLEKIEEPRRRRSESTLRGHLEGEEEDPQDKIIGDLIRKNGEKENKDGEKEDGKSKSAEAIDDYQLSYAIDLIRGFALMKQAQAN
ncbi:MAG: S41 family peptidase [Rhodospirillales bacterium]|nr:S41 family peptidase [Rhodospirillales bacterium]